MKKIKVKLLNIDLINVEYSSGIKAQVIVFVLFGAWILLSNIDKINNVLKGI